ncbi:hypothetical protein [Catellatospora paridis]|uniref:hypothetical protein n=1 Tax=Catellatospora paridis TaxID=1617086 RepID=UPI0012D4580D|nr:hypothetical protein [Catellatospora paridis]
MSHTSFLGIPVEGEITRSDRVPQRPLSELRPLLTAVLDDDAVVEFGWQQYTPYFNDGDTCVFGAHSFWARTTSDAARDDWRVLGVGKYSGRHPTLGGRCLSNRGTYPRAELPYEGDEQERYERIRALADGVWDGEFDDVLLEAFGDHATVTVRRTGITVEFYDHE